MKMFSVSYERNKIQEWEVSKISSEHVVGLAQAHITAAKVEEMTE